MPPFRRQWNGHAAVKVRLIAGINRADLMSHEKQFRLAPTRKPIFVILASRVSLGLGSPHRFSRFPRMSGSGSLRLRFSHRNLQVTLEPDAGLVALVIKIRSKGAHSDAPSSNEFHVGQSSIRSANASKRSKSLMALS